MKTAPTTLATWPSITTLPKSTDELVLTNDLAMTLDSLDSLDGPTEADLFGDDDDIFGEQ